MGKGKGGGGGGAGGNAAAGGNVIITHVEPILSVVIVHNPWDWF